MELYRKISDKPSIIWINGEVVAERIDAGYYHVNHIQLNKSKIPMFKISTYCSLSKKRFNPNKYNKEYFKYIDISNVDNNTGVFEYQLVNIEEAPSRARKKVSKNDIIISTVRPNRNAVAIINIEDDELVVSTGFAVIECKKNIDSYYLFAVLKTSNSIGQLVRKTSGGLYPAVSEQDVMEIEIPIPSPEIQKYIGDKVRKAEELREEAKKLKKEAEEIFYEAIEIDKLNSKLIKVTKFSWIKENQIEDRLDLKYNSPSIITIYEHFRKYKCSLLKDEFKTISGYAFSSGDFDDMDGEKVIKIGDISDFTIDTTSLTRVKIGTKVKERIREFSCNIQDLVYAMTGATIGKVAMYIDNETVYINQRVACIKPKRNNIPTGYLLLYLNSDIGKEISYSLSTGVAQPNIALEELNNIVIPQLANNIMDKIHHNVLNSLIKHKESKQLIQEAKRDVEDLIEGNFDMSKVKANS